MQCPECGGEFIQEIEKSYILDFGVCLKCDEKLSGSNPTDSYISNLCLHA